MCDAFNFFTFGVKTTLLSICFHEVGEEESCVGGGGGKDSVPFWEIHVSTIKTPDRGLLWWSKG